jgi:ABC-type transport system substrate-binding protein
MKMNRSLPAAARAILSAYVRWERWVFVFLFFCLAIGFVGTLLAFRYANTVPVPANGGTYIEGSVGDLQPLNPWFTVTNDVNRDIVSLVFSGLLKYNPQTKDIEPDLADYTVSNDGKTYTVTLKPDLFWQDSTEENPHPVTADDVVFTFKTVQDPEFPNSLLRQNFHGVTIEKTNDRTIVFKLDQPYSFFPSNLTLGLLPAKSFEGVPVGMLDQTLDFGLAPVGAGPYKMKSIVETELSTEVTLERWPRTLKPDFRLDRIVFRIFPDYQTLLSDLRNLDGIRHAPRTEAGKPAVPSRFVAVDYSLPQYVAVFYNLDRPALLDVKLRLGLQLGTDKQKIANIATPVAIVDTPLLEIDNADWRYAFDPQAAQGALFESQWYFPEKVHLQRLLEQREANDTGDLKVEPVLFLDTGAVLTINGKTPGLSSKNKVNGVPLQSNPTESGAWLVALPTYGGTGSLRVGLNLLRLTDEKGKILDSVYVRRITDAVEYQRAMNEQRLVTQFLRSRDPATPASEHITVADLSVDHGYLRRKRADDPIGVRINDRGDHLSLTLLTSPSPLIYKDVAEEIKRQWAALGVDVRVEIPETRAAFEERLLKRDYDLLLFGQSLLNNLDSYPYWHSSGIQHVTENRADLRLDAYNLSQYRSFSADSLLETIRGNTTEAERQQALKDLQNILKRDVPAVFLYSPLYTYAYREGIKGVELGHLSMHSDRFLTLHRWYIKEDRVFRSGKGWLSIFGWLSTLFGKDEASPAVIEPESTTSGATVGSAPSSDH